MARILVIPQIKLFERLIQSLSRASFQRRNPAFISSNEWEGIFT